MKDLWNEDAFWAWQRMKVAMWKSLHPDPVPPDLRTLPLKIETDYKVPAGEMYVINPDPSLEPRWAHMTTEEKTEWWKTQVVLIKLHG